MRGKDDAKAGGAARRDKTSHTFTPQVFIGHPPVPQIVLGASDKRQIKQDL